MNPSQTPANVNPEHRRTGIPGLSLAKPERPAMSVRQFADRPDPQGEASDSKPGRRSNQQSLPSCGNGWRSEGRVQPDPRDQALPRADPRAFSIDGRIAATRSDAPACEYWGYRAGVLQHPMLRSGNSARVVDDSTESRRNDPCLSRGHHHEKTLQPRGLWAFASPEDWLARSSQRRRDVG